MMMVVVCRRVVYMVHWCMVNMVYGCVVVVNAGWSHMVHYHWCGFNIFYHLYWCGCHMVHYYRCWRCHTMHYYWSWCN